MTTSAAQHNQHPRSASELHTPVMLHETLETLAPALAAVDAPLAVDCTLGMGGHTEALLRAHPRLTVYGFDRDPQALALAGERLAEFGERFQPIHAVYDELAPALAARGVREVHGVLFDLGVSSLQLDEASRGFAYAKEAPLDMRMNQQEGETAADLIARLSESELARLFRDYGDEPLAARYARAIVRARAEAPVTTSTALVDLLQQATPARLKQQRHPAKRVFQALRVAVNRELDALATALPAALDSLAIGGRIVVLAYQSHEDKLVKRELAARARSLAPAGLPQELPEHRPEFRLLTRGAARPSEQEQQDNPRAIPARMRAAERLLHR